MQPASRMNAVLCWWETLPIPAFHFSGKHSYEERGNDFSSPRQ